MSDLTDETRAATETVGTASRTGKPAFAIGPIVAAAGAAACLGISFVLTGSGVTAGFAIVHASDAIENQFNLAALPFMLPGAIALALLALALWFAAPRLEGLWVRLSFGVVLATAVPATCAAVFGLLMGDPGENIPWMLSLYFKPMVFTVLLYWLPALSTVVWALWKPRGLLRTLTAMLLSASLGLLLFSSVWYVIGGRTS
ncbi:MAG: hypothetical protein U1E22_08280 [Coriobacteriia bacterium]|nr:hypothetical protein [Coriobacteriia bacterium]